MPNVEVSEPITAQEIAFAHLVLSAVMTDCQAAEAAGLDPDSAAHTKAKPCVRAYMHAHRAPVTEPFVPQEADLSPRAEEELHRLNTVREQVLTRLWEIARLSPEMTRNSVTGQVKAISMISAIEGLIPDRRASATDKDSAPSPKPDVYVSKWLRELRGETTGPQVSPDLVPGEDPAPAPDAPSHPSRGPVHPPEAAPSSPYARVPDSAPDLRVPFHIQKNRFGRRN